MQVPVGAGTQEVTLEAFDFQGQRVASDTITITSTAATPVRDYLRISEIHYHPADPRGDELELDKNEFEFIELVNTRAGAAGSDCRAFCVRRPSG